MSEPMTDAELAAMRARVEAATRGPWEIGHSEQYPTYLIGRQYGADGSRLPDQWALDVAAVPLFGTGRAEDDAEFIAHARDDVPRLLAEVERLRAENAALLEIAQAVADGVQLEPAAYADTGRRICGGCGTVYHGRAEVHASGCPVTLARRIVESEARTNG